MGLLLPVLLLGFAQPVDQPSAPASPQGQVQIQSKSQSTPVQAPVQGLPRSSVRDGHDRKRVCYTMRSYLFERRDDLAPEFLGMTTCTPAQASAPRNVHGKARLVPGN